MSFKAVVGLVMAGGEEGRSDTITMVAKQNGTNYNMYFFPIGNRTVTKNIMRDLL